MSKTVTVGLPNGETYIFEGIDKIHSGDRLVLFSRSDGAWEEQAEFPEGRWAFWTNGEFA